jgi:hypothetical protein
MPLSNKEIQIIFCCSAPTAVKRKKEIKAFLDLENQITVYHVALFLSVPEQNLTNKLKLG